MKEENNEVKPGENLLAGKKVEITRSELGLFTVQGQNLLLTIIAQNSMRSTQKCQLKNY
jgi:hypothetical protein